jgi:GNAT superfamily N-acetyltransferase
MASEYALTKGNRIRLARAFRDTPRVDLSIDCAIEGQMGKAFVDDPANPTAWMIEQSGFFCYFAGDAQGAGGYEIVRSLTPCKMLMPSPPGWLEVAQEVHGDKLNVFDRYSLSSESLSGPHLDGLLRDSPYMDEIRRIDAGLAARVYGSDSFIDLSDFESVEDFLTRGVGFYLMEGDTLVGAAYSSLVCSKGIETSLFVLPEHRRKGVATALASALLKWCLENGADPHWDAANPESCKLARKLGYTHAGAYEAYVLID